MGRVALMFSRVKPLGWAMFEILTSGQMNSIDQQLSYAVDSRGGDYTNATPLVMRGTVQLPNLFDAVITNLARPNGASGWPVVAEIPGGTENRTIYPRSPIYVAKCPGSVGPTVTWTISTDGAIDGNILIVARGREGTGGYAITLVRGDNSVIRAVNQSEWAVLLYSTSSGWWAGMWGANNA